MALTCPLTSDDILRFNPALERSAKEHPKRSAFFAHLDGTASVTRLIDETLRLPLYIRLTRIPKRYLKAVFRKLKSVVGGKSDALTTSVSAVPDCQSSIHSVTAYNIQTPVVSVVIFPSKHQGWKSYRMNIQITKTR